jgi:2-dehydro-3-deoxy-D-arabinonate dehydratase
MRQVRLRGPSGVETGVVVDGTVVTEGGRHVEPRDQATLELPEPYELLLPVEPAEVWCAGVTYERSRDARLEESSARDVYTLVYEAERPELFLKDAGCRRTVGPGSPIGVRSDSSWNVPEPEIGVVLGTNGGLLGVTIGNDVSSRDIEGANPLYLPQAKVYDGSCALGPSILVSEAPPPPNTAIAIRIVRGGVEVFAGATTVSQIKRELPSLVEFLYRENSFPAGCMLMTGTGVIPPDAFTLAVGDEVEITIDGIGMLRNTVTG